MLVHLCIFQLRAYISKQEQILQHPIHINGLVKIGYYLLKKCYQTLPIYPYLLQHSIWHKMGSLNLCQSPSTHSTNLQGISLIKCYLRYFCCCSAAKSCPTLSTSWAACSTPGFLVLHYLPELTVFLTYSKSSQYLNAQFITIFSYFKNMAYINFILIFYVYVCANSNFSCV